MIDLLIFMNVLILFSISLLHFYWALGGNWGIDYTIPEKFKDSFFDPKNKLKMTIATTLVAIGLMAFSLIVASNYQPIFSFLDIDWIINLTRIIGGIFILRAIGDWNIVGLFKKETNSKFAQKDNQIFIPLCFFLGISSILISL